MGHGRSDAECLERAAALASSLGHPSAESLSQRARAALARKTVGVPNFGALPSVVAWFTARRLQDIDSI